MVRHTRVAIIGAGFAGLGAAIKLTQAGVEHLIFEKAVEVGGTWWANSYPGCQCDVPSHLYSFSFAPNPNWTRTYSPQPEIHAYLRDCAERFGVLPRIRFDHEVAKASWDDASQHWRLETSQGDWTAGVLIAAPGFLSAPSSPDLPGLDSFRGAVFHSAAWDHQHDLTGERVALIGTGASAIQIAPRIQPLAGRLHVFQRTPGWVLPHTDRPIRAGERSLYRRFPPLQRVVRTFIYWMRELLAAGLCRNPGLLAPLRWYAMAHLRRQVRDPELRAKLTPAYTPGCKRLLISNDYYPALTAPNVEVVTDAIHEVRPHSIVTADGTERELDTIITATGFRVTDHPMFDRVRGRVGLTLAETWSQTGAQAYVGTAIAGFPNLFVLSGPNTGTGHTSQVVMIESQLEYVLAAIRTMDAEQLGGVEVRGEAQAAFNTELQRRMAGTVWKTGGCASWYLDEHGRNPTLWPDFTWKFHRRTRRFDAAAYHLEPRRDLRHATVVTGDGVELRAEVSGNPAAGVTLVLAHGWALSSRSWALEREALGAGARVVTYDQRGHGFSGPGAIAPSITQLSDDLRAVLDQVVPQGPVVLAGHSMGGMTIMAFAAAHPELVASRVAGVALLSTSAGGLGQAGLDLSPSAAAILNRLLPRLMAGVGRRPWPAEQCRRLLTPDRRVVQRQTRWLLLGAEAPDHVVIACAEMIQRTPMAVIGSFYAALMEHDQRAGLRHLHGIPTLIMVGEADRLTPIAHARHLAEALPEAELVVVAGAGHMLPMERPDLVAEHLRTLLTARSDGRRAAVGAGAGSGEVVSQTRR